MNIHFSTFKLLLQRINIVPVSDFSEKDGVYSVQIQAQDLIKIPEAWLKNWISVLHTENTPNTYTLKIIESALYKLIQKTLNHYEFY